MARTGRPKGKRYELICLQCGRGFDVIKSRKDVAKYCTHKCSSDATKDIPTWNSGKTYDEMYGRKGAAEMKKRVVRHGSDNGMYGKQHSDESKRKMSDAKSDCIPWNTGKTFPGMFFHIIRTAENNAYVKYIMKQEDITYDEYLNRATSLIEYRRIVIRLTELQPIHILENFDKRGPTGGHGTYHLDHIYPISRGFENNISPLVIADISNLQMLPWRENILKSDKLDYENSNS